MKCWQSGHQEADGGENKTKKKAILLFLLKLYKKSFQPKAEGRQQMRAEFESVISAALGKRIKLQRSSQDILVIVIYLFK